MNGVTGKKLPQSSKTTSVSSPYRCTEHTYVAYSCTKTKRISPLHSSTSCKQNKLHRNVDAQGCTIWNFWGVDQTTHRRLQTELVSQTSPRRPLPNIKDRAMPSPALLPHSRTQHGYGVSAPAAVSGAPAAASSTTLDLKLFLRRRHPSPLPTALSGSGVCVEAGVAATGPMGGGG